MILTKSKKESFEKMVLQDTLEHIEFFAILFTKQLELLKDSKLKYSKEVNDLLSEETMERYKSNVRTLKFPYKNYIEQNINEELREGFLIQSWSSIGAILESTLQMFLSIYYKDYIASENNIWSKKVVEEIKVYVENDLNKSLKNMVSNENLDFTKKDRESFLKKIKKIISSKSKRESIERLTLEPLIAFYVDNQIIESGIYSEVELRVIRDYRNSIHSFQKRKIGTWDELNEHGKVLLMLLIDIDARLPPIPDSIPLPVDIYKDITKMRILEQQWFNYSLSQEL